MSRPAHALLVHFKSQDLTRLHRQGQFWHILIATEAGGIGSPIIAQDEIDTWMVHMFIPLEQDGSDLSSEDVVTAVLGGDQESTPVKS